MNGYTNFPPAVSIRHSNYTGIPVFPQSGWTPGKAPVITTTQPPSPTNAMRRVINAMPNPVNIIHNLVKGGKS